MMTRPHFTVTDKKGVAFDANHIFIHRGRGMPGMTDSISFICSGGLISIPASEVETVVFHPDGAIYCNACDKPLEQGG